MNQATQLADALQLWDIHIALTREVIIAATLNSGNLTSSLNALLLNQVNIGNNYALTYGQAVGNEYTRLLTIHINLAVDIVMDSLKKNTAKAAVDTALWYNNADEISLFLSTVSNGRINYETVRALYYAHLKCTLDEATFIISKNWAASLVEMQTCYTHIKELVLYMASIQYSGTSGQKWCKKHNKYH